MLNIKLFVLNNCIYVTVGIHLNHSDHVIESPNIRTSTFTGALYDLLAIALHINPTLCAFFLHYALLWALLNVINTSTVNLLFASFS